jgi:UDP-N-acetylglucosamine---dolichyl-phosphate N-acetylglucosaminyltransferase
MKGLVVVPAYNEEQVILSVYKKIPRRLKKAALDILVINDGSSDNTGKVLKKNKIKHITHPINRGLGAALGTGFEYARLKKYDFLITLDGDGQHDPREINNLVEPIFKKKADFVIGTRFLKSGMPKTRTAITFLASIATYCFTGVWTSDSQSGFRAFSKKAIENIYIDVDRMEVSSDFFRQSREKNLIIKEIPITPIYTDYSLKKGQNFLNSGNILLKLTIKSILR